MEMHRYVFAILALLMTDFTVGASTAQAQGFCRELRRDCLDAGEFSFACRRYRQSDCNERRGERIREREGGGGGGGMSERCRRLQRSCDMRDALGERGQGNCRRFREECGG